MKNEDFSKFHKFIILHVKAFSFIYIYLYYRQKTWAQRGQQDCLRPHFWLVVKPGHKSVFKTALFTLSPGNLSTLFTQTSIYRKTRVKSRIE